MLADPQQNKTGAQGEPCGILWQCSSSSRYKDICALLDSYCVEFLIDGKAMVSSPLHFLEMDHGQDWPDDPCPIINPAIEFRMLRYEPPAEDFLSGIRERDTRWPFFVDEPLTISLRAGDQWCEYRFSPGKTYTERTYSAQPNTPDPSSQHDPTSKELL